MIEKGLFSNIERPDSGWGLRAPSIIVAALCFGATLTPSMLPRDPVIQGALGGAVGAIGYWVATYVTWIWRYLELPVPQADRTRTLRLGALVIALLISIAFLWKAADWQNATRTVMHLPPVETSQPWIIAGVAAAVFLVLILIGRIVGFLMWRLDRLLGRVLPRKIGLAIGLALALFLVWTAVNGVLVQRILEAADASFEAADLLIEPEIPQPTDPVKTGSPASLVEWEEMGRWGRRFVTGGPTLEEITEFYGEGAMEPVRVYIGRRSGDTPEERAELALKELIRAGGFDRSSLVVMVPTGTGWMDAGSHDALDIMLGGDVATVTVQYSYLTSFLALLVHPEYGLDQARVLFDTIYDYWATLPPESRPKFYVHGLSQGAFNSESTLPLLDLLADPISGALWVGSPFLSPMWATMRDGRHPDSPAWRPRWGNGSLARAANQNGFDPLVTGKWGPIRLVFLNYASDPIVVFTFDSGFRRPAWMRGETPFDVSDQLPWIPGVTMFQIALDMVLSLQVPGFGHFYIAPDYIDAWAEVVQPKDWSPEKSDELKAIFETRPAPW